MLDAQTTDQDEGALKHLTDIKWPRIQKGFRLEFYFHTNPFFENPVLTKTYHMNDEDEFFLESATGTEIAWHPEKCLTQKLNKIFGKGSKKAKPMTNKSFFGFFSPPEIPKNLKDMKDTIEVINLKDEMERDCFFGLTIRDEIIPRAVSWFMGEAGLEENTQISAQHSNFLKNLSKKCQGVCWKSKIDPEKGVPNLWLYALQNNDYIDGEISLVEMPERSKKKLMALTTNVMRDDSDKVLSLGQPGEEVTLELILRVVADVGLVGLPNAGKSTLLAATTLAKPDIADYPFTTLMPNLGRLNGDPSLGAQMYTSEATLADLPGLIEGAHLGKGLGRNFLRHLRRTRLLVHVVDAAAEDPVNDYRTVKEELRMYNPDYLDRPYIVVLNKIDIPKASERLPSLTEEIMRLGSDRPSTLDTAQTLSTEGGNADVPSSGVPSRDRKEKGIEDYPRPIAIVGVSVLEGIRTNEMLKEIRAALRMCRD